MSNVTLLDSTGKQAGSQELNSDLFGHEPNSHILYLAKVRQEANARRGTAHTKTRPEVRGGGAKPWRQKGTGRARAGSIRSPLWRGGGVTHGPRNNVNWTKGMNQKESVLALASALQLANQQGRFSVIKDLTITEPKTKQMAEILKNAGLETKKVLIVVDSANSNLEVLKRVSANIPNLKLISSAEINVLDMLKADVVLATQKALVDFDNRFAPKALAV
jgi:large subunit ribosomal protein L4